MERGNRKKTWSRMIALFIMMAMMLSSLSSNGIFLTYSLASEGSNAYDTLIEAEEQREDTSPSAPLEAETSPSVVSTVTPEITELVEATPCLTTEDVVTPTPIPATPTPAVTPILSAIQEQIANAGFAYVTTTDGQTGVFNRYALNSADRVGTLNGTEALLFATEYIERVGECAAIHVWFYTGEGIENGFISEKKLGQTPLDFEAAKR